MILRLILFLLDWRTQFSFNHYSKLEMHLLGKHQVLNAVTAIAVVELLNKKYDIHVSDKDIQMGLKSSMAGRFKLLDNPLFIIDGAHNDAGVNALKNCLDLYAARKKVTLIAGMLRDKDYKSCCENGFEGNCLLPPHQMNGQPMLLKLRILLRNIVIRSWSKKICTKL